MIRTKLAKKVLTKKEQKHLTEMGVSTMDIFNRTRTEQLKFKKLHADTEPCWECRTIAGKLGVA